MEAKLSLSNLEDEHPFFSKTWNSYSEFKQDLDKYQTDENILLSTVNKNFITWLMVTTTQSSLPQSCHQKD